MPFGATTDRQEPTITSNPCSRKVGISGAMKWRSLDKVLEGADAARNAHLQRIRVFTVERERLQLIERVRLRIEIRQRNPARAEHPDGVAVGFGVDDFAVSDGAPGAWLVEYDHRH